MRRYDTVACPLAVPRLLLVGAPLELFSHLAAYSTQDKKIGKILLKYFRRKCEQTIDGLPRDKLRSLTNLFLSHRRQVR
jgi:hypothetical protein